MSNRQIFLTGDTIDLVLLTEDDAKIMQKWVNDENINQFLSMGDHPMTLEAENSFIAGAYKDTTHVVFGIWHKKDQKLIGNTGFHVINQLHQTASFGIVIGDSSYHSNGIGTEVLTLMLSYAFTVRNLRNVTLAVLGNNPGAKRCYEKCGFVDVGTYSKHVYKAGTWQDEHLMIMRNPMFT